MGLAAKIDSPTAFLTAIGRSAETKVTPETWEELWKLDRQTLKKAGLPVRDRRRVDVILYHVLVV
ncbi:hypothetical protein PHLCEN_2v5584 [Hermanssonia centrifuga]|uniref:Small ribosomal subunit protein mS41 SAM domain-containing protein n=1 Tax=Hermanssonia centrifuga TaxID=98765 RepID=A0A2R6P1Y5_9APHY|nr:hypothetical protein PHLCEN_2v5584 [Hermanssonia centrifuga]